MHESIEATEFFGDRIAQIITTLSIGVSLALLRNYNPYEAPTHFRLSDLIAKFDKCFGMSKKDYGKVTGVDVLDSEGVHAFQVGGKAERVEVNLIKVNHEEFKEAIRAKVKAASQNNWDVQIQAHNKQPVAMGDAILVTFYLRTFWVPQESGEGETELNFELGRDPWTKTKTQGRVIHWDTLNEPFDNHDLLDILGKEVAVDWFKLARQTMGAPALRPKSEKYLGVGVSKIREHLAHGQHRLEQARSR